MLHQRTFPPLWNKGRKVQILHFGVDDCDCKLLLSGANSESRIGKIIISVLKKKISFVAKHLTSVI